MFSNSSTFALIVPIFLILLGGTQIGSWLVWRNQPALRTLGIAFIAVSCGMLIQILGWKEPFWTRVAAFSSCYYLATALGGIALAQRLEIPPRYKMVLCIGTGLLTAQIVFSTLYPSFIHRVYALSIGSMFLLGLPLLQWQKMNIRNIFDQYLRWLYVAFIAINAIRTMIQLPPNDENLYIFSPGEFIQTNFWLCLYILLLIMLTGFTAMLHSAILKDLISKLHFDRNQDPLTNILNRRGFHDMTDTLFEQNSTNKFSATLLFCDIDHFKNINDRFGHATGDEVLKQLAAELKKHSRPNDIIARMGGEEFAVLLPHTDSNHATVIAHRLSQAVSAIHMPELGAQKISISIGVANITQPNQNALKIAMREADHYLYTAKNNGRNQVISNTNRTPSVLHNHAQ